MKVSMKALSAVLSTFWVFGFVAALGMSCEEKSDDASDESAAETESEDGADDAAEDTQDEAGTLKIDAELTPLEAMDLISTSLESSGEVGQMNPGTLNFGLTNSQCGADGELSQLKPQAESSGQEGKFAALFAYCNISYPSNGPDTARGGLARVKGMLCELGDKVKYDGETYDETIAFTTPCFTQEFVDMVQDAMGKTSFDGTVTAHDSVPSDFGGNANFEKAIEIEIEEIGFLYKVLYTHDKDANTIAVSIRDGKPDDDDKGVFSVYFDRSEATVLRYEGLFERDSRRVRALIKGTYDADEDAFASITDVEFLSWEDYDGNPPQQGIITLKGNPTDGYRALLGQVQNGDLSTVDFTGTKSHCYGTGDCTGNDGLQPTDDNDQKFVQAVIRDDENYINPHSWFADHGPLDFTAVTFTAD